jgi:hypothetical protein
VAAVSWWLWVLIWLALAVGAAGFLFLMLRQLWRKLRDLFTELGTATERLSAVAEELERLEDRRVTEPESPAVFADPTGLRAERFAARSKRQGSGRRTRT